MPSLENYHRYKKTLLKRIEGIKDTGEPVYCMAGDCEAEGYESHEWHFHHVIKENGYGSSDGGVQHYYNVKEDYEEGEPLMVVCRDCHLEIHNQESLFEEEID